MRPGRLFSRPPPSFRLSPGTSARILFLPFRVRHVNTSLSTPVISDPVRQRRLVLALSAAIFFSVLTGTMFNVSIPDIAQEFRIPPSSVSWVVSGYIIVFALASVTFGKLADLRPIRDLITAGILLFFAGSAIGFFSHHYPMLIAGRVVQASGSGAIPALSMLAATRFLPAEIRGRSLGVIASIVAVGGAVGPLLGGLIASALNWRYLFLLSMASVVSIPVLRGTLPDERRQASGFDALGAALLAGSLAALLLCITVPAWQLCATTVMLGILLTCRLRTARAPFLDPSLLIDHRFRNTLIAAFFTIGTIFGMMFLIPLMLRDLNGMRAAQIGMVMLPGSAGAAVLGLIGGRLTDRKGGAWVVRLGQALLAAGFLLLATAAGGPGPVIALCLVLCYAGFAFLQSSLVHTVSGILPREAMGAGMGLYNLITFLSGAISAAVLGAALDRTHTAGDGAYSSMFLSLALIVLAARVLFSRAFPDGKRP